MDHTSQPLEQLLAQVAESDRNAFAMLYQNSANVLFGVLLRILLRRDIAEEALQDVYIKIWNQAGSYRASRGKALTWMISIARNRALDIKRTLGRETRLPADFDQSEAQPANEDSDPELAAQWGDNADRLTRCMQELSTDQSGSIRLAFLRGYSHSEIAGVLGAPVGTVKSWIRRGLNALKGCLGQ